MIRAASITALVVSAGYLIWRAVFTINPAAWFVAVPMLALEVHHAFGVGIYTFSLWDVSHPDPPPPVIATDLRVAVLIPTYDESTEVLLPVISAALAVKPAHETWVLDDGNRPYVARLAADLGARYLSRPDNEDAKAGNLNNALQHIEADVVAVVDADHVVLPGFLANTLGYFDDPWVAAVQTPQDFYNIDSFEHEDRGADRTRFSEQAVFYRVILPAKNHWDAAFWCGTGALVRVSALEDVGGVATDSITEDIQTSIRLHKAGWRIVAHNEVLARGLAASDVRQYMVQRQRWARGAMQVMKTEEMLTAPELKPTQRLAYAATLWGWFDSLRTLLFTLLPVAVLFTGVMPIDAPLSLFGPLFLATFFMQFAALRLLARGHYPPMLSLTFEMLRMPAVVPAFGELFARKGKKRRFNVTPKGRVEMRRPSVPRLMTVLLVLSVSALVWSASTLAGMTPLTYGNPGAMWGTAGFLAANVALLLVAIQRIRAPQFAGELRASVRFPVDMAASVDGQPGRILDLSLTGARVHLPLAWGAHARKDRVSLVIPGAGLEIDSVVVRKAPSRDGGTDLGVAFVTGQWDAVRRLALALFHASAEAPFEAVEPADEVRVAS